MLVKSGGMNSLHGYKGLTRRKKRIRRRVMETTGRMKIRRIVLKVQ